METKELNLNTKLLDYKSEPIQERIKTFVKFEFPKLATEMKKDDLAKNFQKFIRELVLLFCKIWGITLTYQTELIYQEICDFFESLITKKLYNKIFCSTRAEKEADYVFDNLLKKYQFVTPQMLEINESLIDKNYFDAAINKLSTINQYKAPKDKILTFINVVNILSLMHSNRSKKETAPGAEEIFPLLILMVIKSNVPKLKSNYLYYTMFRYESRIESQEEYYMETFGAIIKFIEELSPEKLSIDKEKFDSFLAEYSRQHQEKLKKFIHPLTGSQDEALLLKYLTEKDQSFIDEKQNIDTVKGYNSNHIFSLDFNKLYSEYYGSEFEDFSSEKMKKMLNDFKAILKLIDSFMQKGSVDKVQVREEKKEEKKEKALIDI